MIKEATATGRTVDAAIEAACEQLGLSRSEVEIEIIDLPRKGFFGLSQTPAKIRAFLDLPECSKMKVAEQYVTDILRAMGLDDIQVLASQEENTVQIKLEGDVSGAAIGRRGETLDALQYLTGLTANRLEGEYIRVVLDSGNYRDKRRHTLEQLARKLAGTVSKTGRSTTLEPMNPYERRIIHSTVSQVEGVVSSSVGEEPNRCVVISSTNPRPQQPSRSNRPQTSRPQMNRAQPSRSPQDRSTSSGPSGRPPFEGGRRPAGSNPTGQDSRPAGRFPAQAGDNRRPGGDRDRRGGRREKPEPYKESGKREVAPDEGADRPLYGKIEL